MPLQESVRVCGLPDPAGGRPCPLHQGHEPPHMWVRDDDIMHGPAHGVDACLECWLEEKAT